MKRVWILLVLCMALLVGCGANTEPEETVATMNELPENYGTNMEIEESAESGSIVVTNVDELLAAIGPDRVIVLEPGQYNLSSAKDYGCKSENEYYTWEGSNDNYELKLWNVENLTIRGNGTDTTTLLTEPRRVRLLAMQGCANIVLENFAAGHIDSGSCADDVLALMGCKKITLREMEIFGRGTVGVQTELCSELSEGSSYGIWAMSVDDLTIQNCVLRNLGDGRCSDCAAALWLASCANVEVINCQIMDCVLHTLLFGSPSEEIRLQNCTFIRNKIENVVFWVDASGMVLDNCTFTQNQIYDWFGHEGITVLDSIGKEWTEEMLDVEYN